MKHEIKHELGQRTEISHRSDSCRAHIHLGLKGVDMRHYSLTLLSATGGGSGPARPGRRAQRRARSLAAAAVHPQGYRRGPSRVHRARVSAAHGWLAPLRSLGARARRRRWGRRYEPRQNYVSCPNAVRCARRKAFIVEYGGLLVARAALEF